MEKLIFANANDRELNFKDKIFSVAAKYDEAVKAGNKDGGAHGEPHAEDMIGVDKGIRKGNGRKLILADQPDHDRIHHVDADRDQALRSDRQRHHGDGLIEVFIFGDQFSEQGAGLLLRILLLIITQKASIIFSIT